MSISFNKIFDYIPKITLGNGDPERWNKIADWISRPAPNRAIMGATALVSQPTIDYFNKNIDEEARAISVRRTLAKVGVGMGVGVVVRQACFDIVKACSSPEGNKRYSKCLIPRSKLAGLKEGCNYLKNYRIFASTFLSLIVMGLGTNFLIDAPLTILATNKMLAHREKKLAQKEGLDANA